MNSVKQRSPKKQTILEYLHNMKHPSQHHLEIGSTVSNLTSVQSDSNGVFIPPQSSCDQVRFQEDILNTVRTNQNYLYSPDGLDPLNEIASILQDYYDQMYHSKAMALKVRN